MTYGVKNLAQIECEHAVLLVHVFNQQPNISKSVG